jgi:glycosyltransferase involved in cell wall biosynthesis
MSDVIDQGTKMGTPKFMPPSVLELSNELSAVTCAIATIGREETLPAVLNSIAFQSYSISELILLDESARPVTENYAVNQALDYLSLLGIRVVVLRQRIKRGIGPARYLLCEEACCDLVLQVDDDVVLHPDCLHHLVTSRDPVLSWAVPTCQLVPAFLSLDGYLDQPVDSDDPRVTMWTDKYPWFVPYFQYTTPVVCELSSAGTQAILLDRHEVVERCSGLKELGRLPREDIYLTASLGPGTFVSPALCLHYEHPSQLDRDNWSKSMFYRLHTAIQESPEDFVDFLGGK